MQLHSGINESALLWKAWKRNWITFSRVRLLFNWRTSIIHPSAVERGRTASISLYNAFYNERKCWITRAFHWFFENLMSPPPDGIFCRRMERRSVKKQTMKREWTVIGQLCGDWLVTSSGFGQLTADTLVRDRLFVKIKNWPSRRRHVLLKVLTDDRPIILLIHRYRLVFCFI